MRYQVKAKVSITGKGNISRVIDLESENPLTVKQIKDLCFERLDIDQTKYSKTSEEVWQSGVSLDNANPDEEIMDKRYQSNPYYYLEVSVK